MADGGGFGYGSGDLGNDGVHRLDRPTPRLSDGGNRRRGTTAYAAQDQWHRRSWYFDDDQEWPDTMQVS